MVSIYLTHLTELQKHPRRESLFSVGSCGIRSAAWVPDKAATRIRLGVMRRLRSETARSCHGP